MKTVIIENKEQVEEIISRCDICFVGITDLEGNPYVIPMNFGYQDGVIYLHSGPTAAASICWQETTVFALPSV